MKKAVIAFPHRPEGHGGPGSFQARLSKVLTARGHRVICSDSSTSVDVVLVVGGTKRLEWIRRCKRNGARIVHRLDGINWRHRLPGTPLRERGLHGVRNWLMKTIRDRFADRVVYQSRFVQSWWREVYGAAPCDETIIYNAVDLGEFVPAPPAREASKPRLLCVEGTLPAIPAYLEPLKSLSRRLTQLGLIEETIVCGDVGRRAAYELSGTPNLRILGLLERDKMPEVFQNSIYLVLEVNPPCPNSVIEALASGAPVIGFDTGSLRELIPPEAGKLVPYGADPWRLEPPELRELEESALAVLADWRRFSRGARLVAEERFGLEGMVDRYLEVLGLTHLPV